MTMKIKGVIIILIFLLLSFFPIQTQSEYLSGEPISKARVETPAFKVGEEFIYSINWGVIPAGSASLKVDSFLACEGGSCYKIKTTTQTNSLFDRIYKVRDSVESLVEVSLKRSRYYRKRQQEGTFRRNDELIFDYAKKEVCLKRDGKVKNVIKIQEDDDLLDPFGVLYYIRSMELRPGDIIEARITDGKGVYQLQVHVLKRERIKTWAGAFNCLKLEPQMQDVEGIFHKKQKAKLYIWLTDDKRKIPVKMQSEALIGSFQGLLKEVR
jgi:hypothetical protein